MARGMRQGTAVWRCGQRPAKSVSVDWGLDEKGVFETDGGCLGKNGCCQRHHGVVSWYSDWNCHCDWMYDFELPFYRMGGQAMSVWTSFALLCLGIACVGLWAGFSKDKNP